MKKEHVDTKRRKSCCVQDCLEEIEYEYESIFFFFFLYAWVNNDLASLIRSILESLCEYIIV